MDIAALATLPQDQAVRVLRNELHKRVCRHYLAIDNKGRFVNSPKTDDELDEFLKAFFGYRFPRRRVDPTHRTQFDFIADLHFERTINALGFANRTGGKALSLNTPILTTTGWKRLGVLAVGDQVYAPDGSPTRVELISDVMHNHQCYEVLFDSGVRIVADAEHIWMTARAKEYTRAWTTEEMYKVVLNPPTIGYQTLFTIELTKPLEYPEAELPIHPYVLGVWLGDGGSYSSLIHCWDAEIGDRLKQLWASVVDYSACNDKSYKLVGLRKLLVPLLGYREGTETKKTRPINKFIPQIYLCASIAQRVELLRGLMDTDGTTDPKKPKCEFAVTSEALARGMVELLRSLGFHPGLYECGPGACRVDGVYRAGLPVFRISFSPRPDINPFYLSRKANRVKQRKYSLAHKVKSITPVASEPVMCIRVAHPSHLYLAGRSLIPTHNTLGVSVLNFIDMLFKPECEVASAGATLSQADKGYRYFADFCTKNPHFEEFKAHYEEVMGKPFIKKSIQSWTEFANGSVLEVLTGTETGLRSPHPNKARIDEIDEMDWNVLQTGLSMAISKTLLDGTRIMGQNVFTSTRQHEHGAMQKLIDTAAEKGITVYQWNIWEAVEECPRMCENDPEHGTCPIHKFCVGRAHYGGGFYKIDDFIQKVRIIDRDKFETEWENKRPSRHKLVYHRFDPQKHVITHKQLKEMTGWPYPQHNWMRVAGLDFGSSPGHPFVYLLLAQIPGSHAWLICYEYVAEQRLIRDHANVIKRSPLWYPGLLTYADWDAQDRMELAALGIRTISADKDVKMGIDTVSELIQGYPPKEEPMLLVLEGCSYVVQEFSMYQWMLKHDGTPDKSGSPDKKNDHAMDAMRYALYSYKRKGRQTYRTRRISGL